MQQVYEPVWVAGMGMYRCRCGLGDCNPQKTRTCGKGLLGLNLDHMPPC